MEVSIFLAKVIGLYFVIACLAMLANQKSFSRIIKDLAKDVPGVFFSGLIALMLGLLVVVSHNIWSCDWRVIITIVGWLMIIKGVARMLMPDKIIGWGLKVYSVVAPIAFIVCLAVGVYLTYIGFTA